MEGVPWGGKMLKDLVVVVPLETLPVPIIGMDGLSHQ